MQIVTLLIKYYLVTSSEDASQEIYESFDEAESEYLSLKNKQPDGEVLFCAVIDA